MFIFWETKKRFRDRPEHGQADFLEFGSPASDFNAERESWHGRGRGGHRHKRGFVKFAVLDLLAEQPRHGYEIIKELEQRYAGTYRPSPGSIYPILQALEEERQVSSSEQDGKKVYSLTEIGQSLVEEHRRHHQDHTDSKERPSVVADLRTSQTRENNSDVPEIKQKTIALMETIRYTAHFGTPAQVKELKKIIEATSRQIHALLAQENSDES